MTKKKGSRFWKSLLCFCCVDSVDAVDENEDLKKWNQGKGSSEVRGEARRNRGAIPADQALHKGHGSLYDLVKILNRDDARSLVAVGGHMGVTSPARRSSVRLGEGEAASQFFFHLSKSLIAIGIEALCVKFEFQYSSERRHDNLVVMDGGGRTVAVHSGREWIDWSANLITSGIELRWKFTNDGSGYNCGWNFTIHPVISLDAEGQHNRYSMQDAMHSDQSLLWHPSADLAMAFMDAGGRGCVWGLGLPARLLALSSPSTPASAYSSLYDRGIVSCFAACSLQLRLQNSVLSALAVCTQLGSLGESVDDCEGGYRECIAEMCEELLEGAEALLLPTPNARGDHGYAPPPTSGVAANASSTIGHDACFLLNAPFRMHMFTFLGVEGNAPLVQWFWDVMEEYRNQERSLFLRFVRWRTRLPRTITDFRGHDFVLQTLLREKLKYAIDFCKSIDTDECAHVAIASSTASTTVPLGVRGGSGHTTGEGDGCSGEGIRGGHGLDDTTTTSSDSEEGGVEEQEYPKS